MINSCLSSIPMYIMGFYLLPESIQQKIDSVRARFYGQCLSSKWKYHMMRWPALCRRQTEEIWRYGFTDCRTMNICLLNKWIYRIEMIKAFFVSCRRKSKQSGDKNASQIWKGLHKVRFWFARGTEYQIGVCYSGMIHGMEEAL